MENLTSPTFTHKLIHAAQGLTFDDVLVIPNASGIMPSEVSLECRLMPDITLPLPFLSAAMDTVSEAPFAIALARLGGMAVIHQNMPPTRQAEHIRQVKHAGPHLPVAAAIGVGEDAAARARLLAGEGVSALVIDTAHGHADGVLRMVERLRRELPHTLLVAGNVATAEATLALINAGVHAVKVGIGPGSICTTRIVAGIGVPQLYALALCADAARPHNIPIIADGGLKHSGDLIKALAAGATAIMAGGMFAGTDETPGDIFTENGVAYKSYRGMGSVAAMQTGSAARYLQGHHAETPRKLVPEGIEARVKAKGPLADVVHQLAGGLRAGMGYIGAASLADIPSRAHFVRLTPASLKESHPHTLAAMAPAPNYGA